MTVWNYTAYMMITVGCLAKSQSANQTAALKVLNLQTKFLVLAAALTPCFSSSLKLTGPHYASSGAQSACELPAQQALDGRVYRGCASGAAGSGSLLGLTRQGRSATLSVYHSSWG